MRLPLTTRLLRRLAAPVAAATALAAACVPAASATPGASSPALRIVTTSNIAADWVGQVGGERVEAFSLMPLGVDPHTFQPGARDVTRVAQADAIFTVGLGLEGTWLAELVRNAAIDPSRIIALGEVVEPLPLTGSPAAWDPHFWQDPLRARRAVEEIAARLSLLDSASAELYQANAQAYGRELDALHAWIEEQVGLLPPDRRVLVTSHDTLGYFAERYGFRVVGTVIPGLTTEREPSAQELAELVRLVRRSQIPAIFAETTAGDRLTRRLAEDAGVAVVSTLYADSLGPLGSDAATYVGMMRANVQAIVKALR